jgi:multisubunit Na+/H+ antiporter MnhG subunit
MVASETKAVSCWLVGFKDWWEKKGLSQVGFPVRQGYDFNALAYEYATTHTRRKVTDYVWFAPDGKVKAMFSRASLDFSKYAGGKSALELMDKWDAHVGAFNSMSGPFEHLSRRANAEDTVQEVWHVSPLWVRAHGEKVILDSTLVTLAISLGNVFLGVLLFTRSLHLALIVGCVVTVIIICLSWFMVVLMGWKVGAVEVLSLIIFIGFAVDYCLHVSHKYHTCVITRDEVDAAEAKEEEEEEEPEPTESQRPRESQSSGKSILARRSRITIHDVRPTDMHHSELVRASTRAHTASRAFASSSGARLSSVRTPSLTSSGAWTTMLHTTGRVNRLFTSIHSHVKIRLSDGQYTEIDRPTERAERAKYALQRMGHAVTGSALTTIGCASFLLACTMNIFYKIGAVVIAVTMFAVLFALVVMPAILMIIGPCHQEHDFKTWLECVIDMLRKEKAGAGDQKKNLYVLNMPCRGMGQYPLGKGNKGDGPQKLVHTHRGPSRTQVVCKG